MQILETKGVHCTNNSILISSVVDIFQKNGYPGGPHANHSIDLVFSGRWNASWYDLVHATNDWNYAYLIRIFGYTAKKLHVSYHDCNFKKHNTCIKANQLRDYDY